ncbi:hypothetical protein Q7I34_00280 [Aeromonas veronii]|uniref:hypothetical protein n=1 Tax=Aeromonas veronii TaxID=654 RepID=UPI0030068E40
MNYLKFKKQNNIELNLLSILGIIKDESRIIQIDNYPDYDLSPYDGYYTQKEYFFRDSWSFANNYAAIINSSIEHVGVFHSDDISRLTSEYEVPLDWENDFDITLSLIQEKNPDIMLEESTEPRFDGFKLNDIQIEKIDQCGKIIYFQGGYTGASDSIQPIDWKIIVQCSFHAIIPSSLTGDFYIDLIAESFALKDAKNYRLSYFIAFSALENYLNERLDSHNKEGRLKDKLSELFKSKFSNLNKHQIYSSIIGEYDSWETIRHCIAHGRRDHQVTKEHVDGFTVFMLTLLASIEKSEDSFDGMSSRFSITR